jgi:hypothetical protein
LQVTDDRLITFVEYLECPKRLASTLTRFLVFFPGTLAHAVSVNCPVSYSRIVNVDFAPFCITTETFLGVI